MSFASPDNFMSSETIDITIVYVKLYCLIDSTVSFEAFELQFAYQC